MKWHQPKRFRPKGATARPSAAKRGYGATWRRMRLIVLHEEPWCRLCGAPATDVDHIVPHVPGQPHDRANLRSLCHTCHSRRTAGMG